MDLSPFFMCPRCTLYSLIEDSSGKKVWQVDGKGSIALAIDPLDRVVHLLMGDGHKTQSSSVQASNKGNSGTFGSELSLAKGATS